MSELASTRQLRAGLLRWVLFLVPGILLLGYLSGVAANSGPGNPWFASLDKPPLYPPPEVFGVVWTVLYILMGLALAIVATARGARGRGLAAGAFLVQLALNLAWSPVFFGAHQMTAALWLLVALDVMVLVTTILFFRVRLAAGLLMLPVLGWVLFATVLNWQFIEANPGADGAEVSGAVTRVAI
ncbi:MAG: tryptophan-rich sensory protein [Novosphingobium sp.]|nr:tryptophan-rich sensory protein [Novosphingobium sp.]